MPVHRILEKKIAILFALPAIILTGCGAAGNGSPSVPVWESETIVQDGLRYSTLKLEADSAGEPHILYSRSPDNQLVYLRRESTNWISDNSGKNSRTADFFLSSTDEPHLIYSQIGNADNYFLRHASSSDGVNWIEGDITSRDDIFHAAAYIDSSDIVHTAYQYTGYDLAYAHGTHAVWTEFDEDTSISDIDIRIEVLVDNSDTPYILYVDYGDSPYTLKLIKDPETALETVYTIDDSGGADDAYSLAVDDTGRIHAAYSWYLSGDTELRYAVYDTSWTIETVTTNIDSGNSPSIAVDSDGIVHIAYTDATDRQLYYARRDGSWTTVQVPTGAARVDNPDLELNNSDQPMIAYADSDAGSLGFAVRTIP